MGRALDRPGRSDLDLAGEIEIADLVCRCLRRGIDGAIILLKQFDRDHKGYFEVANGGTVFLDELGELDRNIQVKLLRFLESGEIQRLGESTPITVDVRVICATHRNLAEMIDERQFRADLFYRLSVFPIELPPQRKRPEDVRLLVHHFATYYATRMHMPIKPISEEFMEALVRHSWPGNVRELQNFIERSVILSKGPVLHGSLSDHNVPKGSAPVTLEDAERSHILQTLRQTVEWVGGPMVRQSAWACAERR